jgi:hypothetical protein
MTQKKDTLRNDAFDVWTVYIGKFSGQEQMNDNWGKKHKWNNGQRFTAYGNTF